MPKPTPEILAAATSAAKGNQLMHCSLNIEMPPEIMGKRGTAEVLCKDARVLDMIAEGAMARGDIRICELLDPFSTLIHTYKNSEAK